MGSDGAAGQGWRISPGWVLAAIGAAAFGLGSAWLLAQSPGGLTQFDRLAGEIGCQCGTCPLRPIGTCGCGFADGMLEELGVLVQQGDDDGAIMTTLVSRYNESIRIKPASSGLGLAAWAAPMLLLTLGAVAVAAVLARWTRSAAGPEGPHGDEGRASADAPEDPERARLRELIDRELREIGD